MLATVVALALLSTGMPMVGSKAMAQATASRQVLLAGETPSDWLHGAAIVQSASPQGPKGTLTLTTNGIPSMPLTRLMQATLAGNIPRVTLGIETTDYNYRPTSILALSGPRIREIDIPGADGANRGALRFTVKFFPAPAKSIIPKANARELRAPSTTYLRTPLPSDFRLEIQGIDCSRVVTVSPLSITFAPKGERMSATYSQLTISISRTYAGPFQQWLAAPGPKNGRLTFLGTDLKTPLYVVDLSGLRIQTITDKPVSRNSYPQSAITMAMGHLEVIRPK